MTDITPKGDRTIQEQTVEDDARDPAADRHPDYDDPIDAKWIAANATEVSSLRPLLAHFGTLRAEDAGWFLGRFQLPRKPVYAGDVRDLAASPFLGVKLKETTG